MKDFTESGDIGTYQYMVYRKEQFKEDHIKDYFDARLSWPVSMLVKCDCDDVFKVVGWL